MSAPPEAGGEAADDTLSREVLAELRLVGGDELVRELMAVFAERTPERLRSAERSLAAGDLEGTAAALHSLRSASGTVGASRVADLAGRLERSARGQGEDDLETGLEELRRVAAVALEEAARVRGTTD